MLHEEVLTVNRTDEAQVCNYSNNNKKNVLGRTKWCLFHNI